MKKSKYEKLKQLARASGENEQFVIQMQLIELNYLDKLEEMAWKRWYEYKKMREMRLVMKIVRERMKIIGLYPPKISKKQEQFTRNEILTKITHLMTDYNENL